MKQISVEKKTPNAEYFTSKIFSHACVIFFIVFIDCHHIFSRVQEFGYSTMNQEILTYGF